LDPPEFPCVPEVPESFALPEFPWLPPFDGGVGVDASGVGEAAAGAADGLEPSPPFFPWSPPLPLPFPWVAVEVAVMPATLLVGPVVGVALGVGVPLWWFSPF
jgi:hypothetical protein